MSQPNDDKLSWSQTLKSSATKFLDLLRSGFARAKAGLDLVKTPQGRRKLVPWGAGAAALLAVLMFGVPRSPQRLEKRLAQTGSALYESIAAGEPSVRESSRIRSGDDRGRSTNLLVLLASQWQDLSVEQRNSLGTWLNGLGGDWEIRVGDRSADGARVTNANAVITSDQWNQQLK